MSALDLFLGPPSPNAARTGVRTLQGPDGVRVHLHDDATCENIVMFSVPHQLEAAPEWRRTYPHPDHPGGLAGLRLDARDGKVYLVEVLPRRLMAHLSFPEALQRHAERFAQAQEWLRGIGEASDQERFEYLGEDLA